MACKILLISLNRCATPDPVFPLGLSHVNAALRRAGHDTRWLDCQADSRSVQAMLSDYHPDIVGISVRNIDDVLISKRETFFGGLGALCAVVRKMAPCPIVLGGSGFSIFPKRLLELSGAEFGIQGEGEAGFLSLIAAWRNGGEFRAIPGLVYRLGAQIVANPQHLSAPDTCLETADRPSELVGHYLETTGMLNLQTQRGCAHACCYCTYPLIEGRSNRRRPAETVAEEMEQVEAQGAKYAFIVDSVFNSSPRHVLETCEAMLRRNLTIRWGCFMRPQGLTPEMMRIMSRAGLAHIEFGSDSFCDGVLAQYGKQFTFEDIRESSDLARKEGIDYCHFLILGGPGETMETLRIGFENSNRLGGAVIMAVVGMRIYPGTALCQRALREGQVTPDTDLLAPAYYLAPGLTVEAVFARLREFSARSPGWIVGDPPPAYARLVQRLRQRGVAGPLWSYLSMIQRLWPPAPVPKQ